MDGTGAGDVGGGPLDHAAMRVTATILGKKWHPIIVAELLTADALGFNELKSRADGISDKVLSESLEDLEDDDVVERQVIEEKPVRVEYSLTPAGKRLERVLAAMEAWGERYLDDGD